jgi:hypothetical protein
MKKLGKTEVHQFDRSLTGNFDVSRLEVSMNDALVVGRL